MRPFAPVAMSLARMGVTRFYLIDQDVFLPENVCRHTLDWGNVGEHKVDALAEQLSRIAPNIECNVSRLHLTGQESTALVEGSLNRLGRCDLVIDATADPRVFNLISAVSTSYKKPVVWMEVYAGGIGGMIARSRPGSDPNPHTMRAAYNHYTAQTPEPPLRNLGNYTAEGDDHIVSASDADVGVIAYHAARLAADTVLNQQPSQFPYSMYLIGLSRAWIFEAPFDTIPIATDDLPQEKIANVMDEEKIADNFKFLANLLSEKSNEHSTS